MNLFKPISTNDILGIFCNKGVDDLQRKCPHIFLAQDLGRDFSQHGFQQISIKFLVQHSLIADTQMLYDSKTFESMEKSSYLYELVQYSKDRKTEGRPIFPRKFCDDKKFTDICIICESDAKIDTEQTPHKEGSFPFDYQSELLVSSIEDVFRDSFIDIQREIKARAFISLHRTMIYGLKILTDQCKETTTWKPSDPLRGETEYVHQLRELETNFPSLDTRGFRKRQSKLYELKKLRNRAEHESSEDNVDFSEKNLLACFHEVKRLFETLENNEAFYHRITGRTKPA